MNRIRELLETQKSMFDSVEADLEELADRYIQAREFGGMVLLRASEALHAALVKKGIITKELPVPVNETEMDKREKLWEKVNKACGVEVAQYLSGLSVQGYMVTTRYRYENAPEILVTHSYDLIPYIERIEGVEWYAAELWNSDYTDSVTLKRGKVQRGDHAEADILKTIQPFGGGEFSKREIAALQKLVGRKIVDRRGK